MKELPKIYEASNYEDKIYQDWEDSGFFDPDKCVEKGVCEENAKPFSIVLPPPNATGSLHIGHAMMLAIEDLMIRYHRMKGDKTLWVPGTDHAAIATNAVVERQLIKEGRNKNDLGREEYVREVKKFIKNSQDNIRRQIRKMGASLDWSREAYTWDEQRNLAVRTVFKKMYDSDLIYRGYRIVNWCPRCHSTLADDEVEYKEENGKLYWIKYGPFVLATARPETKLGDTAVAVHPDDERYKDMVGKKYMIPGVLGEFEITVVADESVDPNFGSGAVKVTPYHSFIDYETAQRHGIKGKQIIDEDGRMMANCGRYAGLTTKEARDAIVADMEKMGLIDHIEEDYKHNLSICYRCGHIVEPIPSKQWFVDVNKEFDFKQSKEYPIKGLENGQKITLKKLMQQVVNNDQIEIIPERFNKTYFNWIDNLRDWCISRQIWVGHQIPVWYKNEEIYVGVEDPIGEGWTQDPDTLDTWFSSGLWTFSTLGYPDLNAKDLKTFHPTTVLETMFDIIFFWVARMIMMTTFVLGEIPFEKVYLHARVLDKDGEKMSKSKPETMIDPLDVCKKYGTDAVRLSLLLGVSPGSDVRLSEDKIEGFKHFANKLWNMSRFMLMNIDEPKIEMEKPTAKTLADKWIMGLLDNVIKSTKFDLENFNFSQAGERLKSFTWDELADWYLEIAKVEGDKSEILNYVLNTVLKLWHPFMPFVTEAIWREVYGEEQMLMVEKWPESDSLEELGGFPIVKNLISQTRSLRSQNKIEPSKKIKAMSATVKHYNLILENKAVILQLAGLSELEVVKNENEQLSQVGFVSDGILTSFDLAGAIDVEKEKNRLQKEIANVEPFVKSLRAKLSNQSFVDNAPKQVVENERKKLQEAEEKLDKLQSQLENLK